MFVLLSCIAEVAVHFILPLVFKTGQYLHCFFAMHLFLTWFVVRVTVCDILLVTVVSLSFVIVVTKVLPRRGVPSLGFLVRKSSMVCCFVRALYVFPCGKINSLALFFGSMYRSVVDFGIVLSFKADHQAFTKIVVKWNKLMILYMHFYH